MIPASKKKLIHCDLKNNLRNLRIQWYWFCLKNTYIRAVRSVGKAKHRWINTWSVAYIEVNKKNPPIDKDHTLNNLKTFRTKSKC
jgi:hypothetical protein